MSEKKLNIMETLVVGLFILVIIIGCICLIITGVKYTLDTTDDNVAILNNEEMEFKLIAKNDNCRLYVDTSTNIVYIIYKEGSGRYSTIGMVEYKSSDGNDCRYENTSIVDIKTGETVLYIKQSD